MQTCQCNEISFGSLDEVLTFNRQWNTFVDFKVIFLLFIELLVLIHNNNILQNDDQSFMRSLNDHPTNESNCSQEFQWKKVLKQFYIIQKLIV